MLLAAGLTQNDPVLAILFRVERLCDAAMEQFNQVVDLDPVSGASHELLAGIVGRGRWICGREGYRAQYVHMSREKAMMRQLGLSETVFKRFPGSSTQLTVSEIQRLPGKARIQSCGST